MSTTIHANFKLKPKTKEEAKEINQLINLMEAEAPDNEIVGGMRRTIQYILLNIIKYKSEPFMLSLPKSRGHALKIKEINLFVARFLEKHKWIIAEFHPSGKTVAIAPTGKLRLYMSSLVTA